MRAKTDSTGSCPNPVVGSFSTILFSMAPPSRVVRELVDLPPGAEGGDSGRAWAGLTWPLGVSVAALEGGLWTLSLAARNASCFPHITQVNRKEVTFVRSFSSAPNRRNENSLCYKLSQLPGVLSLRQWRIPGVSDCQILPQPLSEKWLETLAAQLQEHCVSGASVNPDMFWTPKGLFSSTYNSVICKWGINPLCLGFLISKMVQARATSLPGKWKGKSEVKVLVAQSCLTLWSHGL